MSINPNPDQTALRARIAEALVSWTYRGKEPDPETGMLETVRANAYSRADAVLAVLPAPVQAAALAEDLRYVLGHTGPRHAHEKPGVWDTSGKPCGHCARLAVARQNLAAYDEGAPPALADRAATLREAATRYEEILVNADTGQDPRYWTAVRDVTLGLRAMAAEAPRRSDVGTEFVQQIDHPDTAGLDAVDADLAAEAPHAATPDEEPLLCPRCGTDISDYGEDDFVFRTGDERPYCSGECIVAAHRAAAPTAETVHACPPDGSGLTPCCGRTPFELPRTDRISSEATAVTCAPAVVAQPGKENDTGARIVAHVLATHTDLHCLNCAPPPHGDIWTLVTVDELDDGGVCVRCGVDVLIPQAPQ